jgi:DNA-binding GntR family transcriptional regulator
MCDIERAYNLEETSLQEQAYKTILRKIIYSDLAPGQKISEKELENTLDIGRTPIREALIQLRKQELVYVVPQSGTYISKINLKSAHNARFTREHLERKVMTECIAKIDEQGKVALAYVIEKQRQAAIIRDKRDFFFFDNVFHRTCYEIAGREDIWHWMDKCNAHLERFRWLRITTKELDWQQIINQHQKILDTIVSKNIDEIDFIMALHLHMMLDEEETVVSEYPDYFLQEDEAV